MNGFLRDIFQGFRSLVHALPGNVEIHIAAAEETLEEGSALTASAQETDVALVPPSPTIEIDPTRRLQPGDRRAVHQQRAQQHRRPHRQPVEQDGARAADRDARPRFACPEEWLSGLRHLT